MTRILSPAELGIMPEEHEALLLTRQVLATEQIIFDMGTQCSVHLTGGTEYELPDGDVINLQQPQPPCRTNCCIGGTMKLLMLNGMQLPPLVTPEMGEKIAEYVNRHEPYALGRTTRLSALFWANTESDTTPQQGIEAIDRFLAGNTADPWAIDS